jgi:uncharacterized protein YwqG
MDEKQNKDQKRTPAQNRSGHLYFTEIADTLNNAGYDQRLVLTLTAYEVPNTMESVKAIFRSFGEAMFGKKSTADLTTKEFSEVAEVLNRELSEKLSVELPDYPSMESLFMKRAGLSKKKMVP